MSAKVSVIMPSLNVADYIEECLNSVVNQTLSELEIICVDAGSTDGTYEICNAFAQKDRRIKVIKSDKKSYGHQVNLGLSSMTGEYVAILETDDYIDCRMYERLYAQAVLHKLDYIAADFDSFYTLQNGERFFRRECLFHGNKLWYNQILQEDRINSLRLSDYLLWKGIYNSQFLVGNHIRLHESYGAAYQDMGFLQQVKTYAKRAMYIDESFYRYRRDRQEASTHQLNGLQFYHEEFLWIESTLKLTDNIDDWGRINYYTTKGWAFLGKYDEILKKLSYDYSDNRLQSPYQWFKSTIDTSIARKDFVHAVQNEWYWDELMMLLESPKKHAEWFFKKNEAADKMKTDMLQKIDGRKVIIWGCGVRGERLMLFCDRNHITIDSFCDNNSALFGSRKFGFPIISQLELKSKLHAPDIVVLLSMKNGADQVHRQLEAMGIKNNRIIDKIPKEIL